MSLEWMGAHNPEILTAGDTIYKQDEPITTPFALYFAPDGDGAVIVGTHDELVAMLDNTRRRLLAAPEPVINA